MEQEGDKEKSPQGLAFLWDYDCPLWFSTALEHSIIFLNLPTASAGPSQHPGPVGLEAIGGQATMVDPGTQGHFLSTTHVRTPKCKHCLGN